jgi:hypothetical protein
MSNSEASAIPARVRRLREKPTSAMLVYFVLEVLGSLVVMVLLNFFALWYLGHFSTNFGYWTIHQKWALLGKMDAPVDWLILGDSSCNQGVSPAQIQEQLGETAMNLCTVGNMTVLNDVWMLEEYIQRFGPPKGVVIGHVYDIWYRDLDTLILGQIPRPWGFWKEHTLGKDLLDSADIRSSLIQERIVPLLSQRLTIREMLRSFMFGRLLPFKSKWHIDEYGFLKSEEAQPEFAIQDGQKHMQFVDENDPSISSINQQALERLIEIAETYQLPIYLVNSPLYEGLNADDEFQTYLAELHRQIKTIIGESQYVHMIPEIKTFPATQLQTADHLTFPGAKVYTDWLIQKVLAR